LVGDPGVGADDPPLDGDQQLHERAVAERLPVDEHTAAQADHPGLGEPLETGTSEEADHHRVLRRDAREPPVLPVTLAHGPLRSDDLRRPNHHCTPVGAARRVLSRDVSRLPPSRRGHPRLCLQFPMIIQDQDLSPAGPPPTPATPASTEPEPAAAPKRRRGRLALLASAAATAAWLVWEALTWPDVATLARRHPKTTAFIEEYRYGFLGALGLAKPKPVQCRWVAYGRISPNLKVAVLIG